MALYLNGIQGLALHHFMLFLSYCEIKPRFLPSPTRVGWLMWRLRPSMWSPRQLVEPTLRGLRDPVTHPLPRGCSSAPDWRADKSTCQPMTTTTLRYLGRPTATLRECAQPHELNATGPSKGPEHRPLNFTRYGELTGHCDTRTDIPATTRRRNSVA